MVSRVVSSGVSSEPKLGVLSPSPTFDVCSEVSFVLPRFINQRFLVFSGTNENEGFLFADLGVHSRDFARSTNFYFMDYSFGTLGGS